MKKLTFLNYLAAHPMCIIAALIFILGLVYTATDKALTEYDHVILYSLFSFCMSVLVFMSIRDFRKKRDDGFE